MTRSVMWQLIEFLWGQRWKCNSGTTSSAIDHNHLDKNWKCRKVYNYVYSIRLRIILAVRKVGAVLLGRFWILVLSLYSLQNSGAAARCFLVPFQGRIQDLRKGGSYSMSAKPKFLVNHAPFYMPHPLINCDPERTRGKAILLGCLKEERWLWQEAGETVVTGRQMVVTGEKMYSGAPQWRDGGCWWFFWRGDWL